MKRPRHLESSPSTLAMKQARDHMHSPGLLQTRPPTQRVSIPHLPAMSYAAISPSRTSRLFPRYDCPFLPAGRVRRRPTSTANQCSLRRHIATEPQHPPHRPGPRSPLKNNLNPKLEVSPTARSPAFTTPLLHRGISTSTYDRRYSI